MYLFKRGYLRYAFKGELVIGVERQASDFKPAFLFLDMVDLFVNLHKH